MTSGLLPDVCLARSKTSHVFLVSGRVRCCGDPHGRYGEIADRYGELSGDTGQIATVRRQDGGKGLSRPAWQEG